MLAHLVPILLRSKRSISDNFDRASPVLSRSDGGLWTLLSGSFALATNQLQGATFNAEIAANLGKSDFTMSCDITTDWTGFPQLHFRGDGSVNNLLLCWISTDGSMHISQTISGSTTGIVDGAAGDFPQNVKATLSIIASGTGLIAQVNGVTKLSSSSSTFQTQTWVGIHVESAQALFDNFSAA